MQEYNHKQQIEEKTHNTEMKKKMTKERNIPQCIKKNTKEWATQNTHNKAKVIFDAMEVYEDPAPKW